MAKFNLVSSLAGTGRSYIDAQAVMRDTVLHIQVLGKQVNREYGAVQDINMDSVVDSFQTWLQNASDPTVNEYADRKSAASDKTYFRIQFSRNNDGSFKFQIPGPEYNRGYGATFTASAENSDRLATVDDCVNAVDMNPHVG